MIEKLQVIGVLDKDGISKNNENIWIANELEEEDGDSDYSKEEEEEEEEEDDDDNSFIDTYNDELDEYFLNLDDYRPDREPSLDDFPINESLTGTSVLKSQPLGVIKRKKRSKQLHISNKYMLKEVIEKATFTANQSILNSDSFRYTLDLIVNKAQDYEIFQSS